ncbi:MAG: hypothetical protein VX438_03620 [Planctomycetota bacterium]|nr:hypothetical protein [Planctomycetota bacterium]
MNTLIRITTFGQLIVLLTNSSIGQDQEPRNLFRKWDRNRDRVLTRQEVPEANRARFDEVDENHDGRISWQEHLRAFQDGRKPMRRERGNTGPAALAHWKHADLQQLAIRQVWAQEPKGFDRTAIVSQPKHARGKLPVIAFFHGAGGNAVGPMRQWEDLTYDCVVVSAQGYRKTWNIHGEPSKAPDVEFFKQLLKKIEDKVPTANLEDLSLIGFSNGSGFIHRLLIELESPFSRRNFLLGSSLIEQQYHDGSFWKPSSDTDNYDTKIEPKPGRMLAYFHGTNDRVVPYEGGKRGKFPHVSALETANAWAKANGYRGKPRSLKQGKSITDSVTSLTFAGTDVTFYSVNGGGHGFEPHERDVRKIIRQLLQKK